MGHQIQAAGAARLSRSMRQYKQLAASKYSHQLISDFKTQSPTPKFILS